MFERLRKAIKAINCYNCIQEMLMHQLNTKIIYIYIDIYLDAKRASTEFPNTALPTMINKYKDVWT